MIKNILEILGLTTCNRLFSYCCFTEDFSFDTIVSPLIYKRQHFQICLTTELFHGLPLVANDLKIIL